MSAESELETVGAQPTDPAAAEPITSIPEGVEESSSAAPEFTSLTDAFEAASRATGTEQAADTPTTDPEGSAPVGESAATSKAEATPPQRSFKGTLDRIDALFRQGRIDDLTPEERGVYQRLRQGISEQQRAEANQEKEFKSLFLEFDELKHTDPAAWAAKIEGDPNILQFYKAYQNAHPDISIDTPDGEVSSTTSVRARQEVDAQWRAGLGQTLAAIAADAGIPEARLNELSARAPGPFSLVQEVIDEAVRTRLEKERPGIAAAERDAARKEAQAEWAPRTMKAPASLGGRPVMKDPAQTSGPVKSIGEAYDQAVKALA